MKKNIISLICFLITGISFYAQNVGIGTTSPSTKLHIVGDLNNDPLTVEGFQLYTNETSVLVVNPTTGVVKHMPINMLLENVDSTYLDSTILTTILNHTDTLFTLIRDSLLLDSTFIHTLRDSADTDIDSMIFLNDTLYLYEDNQVLTAYISAGIDTALLDSLIISNTDSVYTIISDSLLKDTLWLSQLDSLLGIYGDTIYFNDSSYALVRDSLLRDTAWLNALQDSINTDNQNIDSLTIQGTILTTYIEDGTSASIDLSSTLDSVILSKSDTLYSIISDSLTMDTLWLSQLDSLLGIYGDTIYFNDSSYTLVRDSLLRDTAWLNALQDSINTDNQNIDSLTIQGTILTTYIEDGTSASIDLSSMLDSVILSKSDTLYSIISDSLLGDSLFLDSLISILNDSLDPDNDWNINANGTGLEAAPAGDNFASGDYAIASGQNDTASGTYSAIVGGSDNRATGPFSTILGGDDNSTIGRHSLAFGSSNQAMGAYSITLGDENMTLGDFSTALGGLRNRALGSFSAVLGGSDNVTSGEASILLGGNEDTAFSAYETVLGIYSTSYTPSSTTTIVPTDRLLTVGNGTASSSRSNALVLYKSGSLEINEEYTFPNVDGTANQVLVTDGSGNVTWQSQGGSGSTFTHITISSIAVYNVPNNISTVFCLGGVSDVVLPDATLHNGRRITIKNKIPQNIKVRDAAGHNVEGVSSYGYANTTILETHIFMSDGSNWWIVAN